jgi:hypothetical protein
VTVNQRVAGSSPAGGAKKMNHVTGVVHFFIGNDWLLPHDSRFKLMIEFDLVSS